MLGCTLKIGVLEEMATFRWLAFWLPLDTCPSKSLESVTE